jgi:hypothetical protein
LRTKYWDLLERHVEEDTDSRKIFSNDNAGGELSHSETKSKIDFGSSNTDPRLKTGEIKRTSHWVRVVSGLV